MTPQSPPVTHSLVRKQAVPPSEQSPATESAESHIGPVEIVPFSLLPATNTNDARLPSGVPCRRILRAFGHPKRLVLPGRYGELIMRNPTNVCDEEQPPSTCKRGTSNKTVSLLVTKYTQACAHAQHTAVVHSLPHKVCVSVSPTQSAGSVAGTEDPGSCIGRCVICLSVCALMTCSAEINTRSHR